jgi:hypothetical protein
MERKFYPENFEKFLKGHADEFKMIPSKKTWHGIYNDLHPGRRWPSITMSFVFIFALVIIGHLNSNNEYHNSTYGLKILSASNIRPPISSVAKQHSITSPSNLSDKENNFTTPTLTTTTSENITAEKEIPNNNNSAASNIQKGVKNYPRSSSADRAKVNNTTITPEDNSSAQTAVEPITGTQINNELNNAESNLENTSSEKVGQNENKTEKIQPVSTNKKSNPTVSLSNTLNNGSTVIKVKKVRNNPAIFTYYLSPSLSYRKFSDNELNKSVTHKPIIGYEGGVTINTKLVNQLRFTTGLQLNYSGYNIKASTTHPIIATLLLNTEVPGQSLLYSTISSYGNGTGNEQTNLKNYNLQVSLPVGLQYSFGGNDDDVLFNVEATLQPSYVIKDHAYLLSTDGKNYLTDPSLFHNWNMNTNLGTYISFKSTSLKWQIGPQVRYQMLSSYLKAYQVKEHLINYGVRIGISRISK